MIYETDKENLPPDIFSDPVNLCIRGIIRNVPDLAFFTDKKGSLCVVSEFDTYLYTQSIEFIEEVLSGMLKKPTDFSGVNEFVYRYLTSRYKPLWKVECGMYIYNGKPLLPAEGGFLPPLKPEFWKEVSDGTVYKPDREEITECLSNRLSSAVYANERPVCWCLLHIENSMGMLYTVPEFRRKGLALKVMKDITRKVIATGETPFAYIVKGNSASECLAPKYNLAYSCDAYFLGVDLAES